MNKAYNNKHDVFCFFLFPSECWMSKWMNEYQWEICVKLKCDSLPKSDINITQMTYDGLP